MTLTGFLFLAEALLAEVDTHVAYTVGQWSWRTGGRAVRRARARLPERAARRADRPGRSSGASSFGTSRAAARVAALPAVPGRLRERVPHLGRRRRSPTSSTRCERAFNATVGLALAVVGISRWLRAAPPLRRLLLPTLAGSVTALVLVSQVYYALLTGEFIRPSQEITAACSSRCRSRSCSACCAQRLARAAMADLVVALSGRRRPTGLGDALGEGARRPVARARLLAAAFEAYVDADGRPVALPAPGSRPRRDVVERDGEPSPRSSTTPRSRRARAGRGRLRGRRGRARERAPAGRAARARRGAACVARADRRGRRRRAAAARARPARRRAAAARRASRSRCA